MGDSVFIRLICASADGDSSIAQYHWEHGANKKIKNQKDGQTAFHFACKNNKKDAVEYLHINSASQMATDNARKTPQQLTFSDEI